ncbi:hypothetical protein NUH88_17265 [Nisaea acidiphila]|uniref:Outer membrane beta-barrel protein n=1 Tax=Nisaea acidiphila TaxID=1862145 RepID=A0A9J7AUQ9_9PROT|nr:hypothetical protein [Nisaea acidiphila]UUX49141.1 hypothetical protein NUH88_17265 [Nisaea acidiphila]
MTAGSFSKWAAGLCLAAASLPAVAEEPRFDATLEVGAELRLFPNSPAFPVQRDRAVSPSIYFEPEFTADWNGGDDRLTLVPFARLDRDDDRRTHADLREANWLHIGEGYDLVVGADKVFWGVTESRHLVDIINQSDALEDIDQEDKLGQPMVQIAVPRDWGTTSLFVMPYFRERTFPDRRARLSGGVRVDSSASYDSDAEEFNPDIALRWAHVIGDFDIGLSHFHGTSREPRLLQNDPSDAVNLTPHYDLIDQTGLDLQYTTDAWLWKLEAIGRAGHGDYFGAAVAGFEYTLFGIAETDMDLGFLAEYQYDGRDEGGDAPGVLANNDTFLGARLTLNDVDDSSLLAGAVVDNEDGSTLLSLEAERRIGDAWKVEAVARFFVNTDERNPLHGYDRDDFVSLTLIRYF